MTIHRVEQGSPEWHALRCGKATGSRVASICRKVKSGGYSADRANYLAELVLERLTGRAAETYVSRDMEIGTLREPDARVEYELRHRCEVEQIGFVDHPTIAMSGASTDGFIGDDGLLEIKCPIPATHLSYLRAGVVPSEYLPQIMWNFACNPTRQWCDFCSFHPDFPEPMVLFTVRVLRDDDKISFYEGHVAQFLKDVDEEVANLRAVYIERRNLAAEQLQASVNLLEAS